MGVNSIPKGAELGCFLACLVHFLFKVFDGLLGLGLNLGKRPFENLCCFAHGGFDNSSVFLGSSHQLVIDRFAVFLLHFDDRVQVFGVDQGLDVVKIALQQVGCFLGLALHQFDRQSSVVFRQFHGRFQAFLSHFYEIFVHHVYLYQVSG